MVTNALIAAAVMVCSQASRADEESHRKAAEALLESTNVAKQLQSSIDQSVDIQVKANPQLAGKSAVLKKFFSMYMSWDSLKDDMIKIYTDAFSEEELKKITEFYKSPVGKKMIEKMPELMGKGMQLGVKRVQENQGELIRMLKEDSQSN
jgi:hypothetical protein